MGARMGQEEDGMEVVGIQAAAMGNGVEQGSFNQVLTHTHIILKVTLLL